jgi:hypothetical protein
MPAAEDRANTVTNVVSARYGSVELHAFQSASPASDHETPTFYPYLSGRANLRYFQGIGRRGGPADVDRLLDLVERIANS